MFSLIHIKKSISRYLTKNDINLRTYYKVEELGQNILSNIIHPVWCFRPLFGVVWFQSPKWSIDSLKWVIHPSSEMHENSPSFAKWCVRWTVA